MKDLIDEIDAIVQNSNKKSLTFTTSHYIEVVIDKKNSDTKNLVGKFSIMTEKKYLGGEIETSTDVSYNFMINEKDEFVIEAYNQARPIDRDVMKSLKDAVTGIKNVAATSVMTLPIHSKSAFHCSSRKIYIICETWRNQSVKDIVSDMLFSGEANSHVDIGMWGTRMAMDFESEKAMKWSMLEIERRASNGESIIVTGEFKNWYELMPIVVIASIGGHSISLGRTVGQKLSIGGVLDINNVIEFFSSNNHVLTRFFRDPYSSIEHFKSADNVINSLVIFPSVLHNFLSR